MDEIWRKTKLKGWFEKLEGLTRESSMREKRKVICVKPKVRSSQALPKHVEATE